MDSINRNVSRMVSNRGNTYMEILLEHDTKTSGGAKENSGGEEARRIQIKVVKAINSEKTKEMGIRIT